MYFFTVVLRKGLCPHIDNDPKVIYIYIYIYIFSKFLALDNDFPAF